MSTVASCFGHYTPREATPHPNLAFNAHVGIELEIEECTYIDVPYWDCKEDGSLRNGCELVCAEPYAGETLYAAIEALADEVGKTSAQGTWRCSTHVHLDVRDLESPALKKLILAYAFYEKVLFKCSGFHRYRSNFCPAFAVVQQQIFNTSVILIPPLETAAINAIDLLFASFNVKAISPSSPPFIHLQDK